MYADKADVSLDELEKVISSAGYKIPEIVYHKTYLTQTGLSVVQ